MLQVLIQGLLLSGLYALIAVGFTLIFSIGRVLNLAYGAYLLIGGYVFFFVAQTMGLPKIVALLLAAIVGCVMGLAKFRLIVKPLKGDHVAVEISTLILAVVLQAAVILIFGDSSKILLPIVPGVERIAGAAIPLLGDEAVVHGQDAHPFLKALQQDLLGDTGFRVLTANALAVGDLVLYQGMGLGEGLQQLPAIAQRA